MSTAKILATMSLGFIAAACAGPYDRQPLPSSVVSHPASSAERACLDYGFTAGTSAFDRCVQREAAARQAGRVNRDYAQARLVEDARRACDEYGVTQNTQRYNNCVAREIDARRYQQSEMVVPAATYTQTQYSASPPYTAEPRPGPSMGMQVSRDEYGFRYDAEGNRLDRNGRIISPQDTTP